MENDMATKLLAPVYDEPRAKPYKTEEGATYSYVGGDVPGCQGHLYRVAKASVEYVPVGAVLVLVECLSGPDKGLLFVCSPGNFATRYERAEGQGGS